jgi:two-component system, OmpR family, response regulator
LFVIVNDYKKLIPVSNSLLPTIFLIEWNNIFYRLLNFIADKPFIPKGTAGMGKKKVVIIDDERDLCHLLKTFLSDLDCEVHYAHTLDSGLDILQKVNPDVIFMDNNLPDGLGWERLRQLKETFPSCRINLISAFEYIPPDLLETHGNITVIEKPLSLTAIRDYL